MAGSSSKLFYVYFLLLGAQNSSSLLSKLRLPAPSAAAGKPHTDVPTKAIAADDGDNIQSSLLAGMV